MKKICILFCFSLLAAALLAVGVAAETAEGGEGDILVRLVVCFGIGLVTALVTVLVMARRMSTVRAAKTADSYVKKNSFFLSESRDIYLYSRISRIRINTNKKN